MHRDLAVRNFLLTTEGGLKVADFGTLYAILDSSFVISIIVYFLGMSRDLSDGLC